MVLRAQVLRRFGASCSATPRSRRPVATVSAASSTAVATYADILSKDEKKAVAEPHAAHKAAAPQPLPPPPEHNSPVPPPAPDPGAAGKPKVAALDAENFLLHPSVEFWQTYGAAAQVIGGAPTTNSASSSANASASASLVDTLNTLVRRFAANANIQDAQSATYWAYHTARLSFFITQAVAGVTAHHVYETLQAGPSVPGLTSLVDSIRGNSGGSATANTATAFETPLARMQRAGMGNELLSRTNEALATFKQDYANIQSGAYGLPWDMTSLSHRQYSPVWQLGRTALWVQNAVGTLSRRVRQAPDDVWLRGPAYPQYYTNTFHYQGDGWFSDSSARVYEHSTEVLFFGRQDAMQRTSLLPIADYMRVPGRMPANTRLLEVAAGTGRFHTFIKDTYPTMPTTVSDLSPFYLARARENIAYWHRMRQPGQRLGGVDNTGTQYLQCAAEELAVPDASQDIVVCVYLFHELPEAVRRRVAGEMFRVLKPGGLLVITDSVQTGDREAWDATLSNFGNFNEPYYESYIRCDLGGMFKEAGFQPYIKYMCSASKTLSFIKPGGELPPPQPILSGAQ